MRKMLMATTAIVALATPAFAQTQASGDAMGNTAATGHDMKITLKTGYQAGMSDNLATVFIGQSVWTSAAQDAELVGDVNDLVIGPNGDVLAAVVGVGGFLGIGEKSVAVGYEELDWEINPNGDEVLTIAASREMLESAPEFKFHTADQVMGDAEMHTDPLAKPMAPGTENAQDLTMADRQSGNGPLQPGEFPSAAENLEEVNVATLSADELIGTRVLSSDETDIGEVDDIVLDGTDEIDALIIDVGGFLGIGEKPVAVAPDNLTFMADASGQKYVWLDFSRAQLESQPAYDASDFNAETDVLVMSSLR